MAITIDGYHRLADTFFGDDSFEAHQIRRVVAAEFPPYVMLYAKWIGSGASLDDRRLLGRLVDKVYEDPSWRNRLYRSSYKMTPVSWVRALAELVARGSAKPEKP
jgi:hypothetical protein